MKLIRNLFKGGLLKLQKSGLEILFIISQTLITKFDV